MPDSKTHSDHLAAFREWAHSPYGKPKSEWIITREQAYELFEQKEAADRVLVVADQLAEWCRVTTSVDGVFSNNLGAQAQAQGMANLVVRYIATRESYPASRFSEGGDSAASDGSVPGTPGLDGCAERQSRPASPPSESLGASNQESRSE